MLSRQQSVNRLRLATCRSLRCLCVLIVLVGVIAPLPIMQTTSAAVGIFISFVTQSLVQFTTSQQDVSRPPAPEHSQARRVRIIAGESRTIPFAVPITSVLVVSPEIAAAALNVGSVLVTGLRVGETILIAFDGPKRYTFVVEVVGRTQANTAHKSPMESAAFGNDSFSGSYSVSYS